MNTFFSADYHIAHVNILEYDGRPYKTIEEMKEDIIRKHNERVKVDDTMNYLGDLGFWASQNRAFRGEGQPYNPHDFLSEMNGRYWNFVCLTEDTKTYIKNKGFLHYKDIQLGDKVLGIDYKTKNKVYLKWHKITQKQVHNYNNKTYTTNNRVLQMHVTPKHSICLYPSKLNGLNFRYRTAEELFKDKHVDDSSFKIPVSGELQYSKTEKISNNNIKLLAWIVSEGTINKYKQIQIYQNVGKNLKRICDLLDKEKIQYSVYNGKTKKHKVIYIKREFTDFFIKYLPTHKLNIQSIIDKFSKSQLLLFLKEYILGDGHKAQKNNSFHLYTKDKLLAEQLAFIGTITGYRSYIKKQIKKLNNKSFTLYIISFQKFYYRELRYKQLQQSSYNGFVYDFTTEIGNFLVMRNGTSFFTGNCGNHDKSSNKFKPKIETSILNQNGLRIQLIHDPMYAKIDYDLIICGHVHNSWKVKELHYCGETRLIINVGCSVWNYYPVSLDEILCIYHRWLNQRKKIVRDKNQRHTNRKWELPAILKELNKGTLYEEKQ